MSVPVTGYILPVCITKVLLFVSVWTCGFNLFLICVNSQEFMTECTHTVWLIVSFLCFYMMGLGANFTIREHPVPAAMLIVTMISGPIQYLRYTVSIGNRFPWLYISFQSPWFHYIIIESTIFPWWLSKRGAVLFFKERGDIKKGGLIHLSALWIYLKNKKLKNLAFEKNINNKSKGVSGMK